MLSLSSLGSVVVALLAESGLNACLFSQEKPEEAIACALDRHYSVRIRADQIEIIDPAQQRKPAPLPGKAEPNAKLHLPKLGIRFDSRMEQYIWTGTLLQAKPRMQELRFRLPKLGQKLLTAREVRSGEAVSVQDIQRVFVYWKPGLAAGIASVSELPRSPSYWRRSKRTGVPIHETDWGKAYLVKSGDTVNVTEQTNAAVLRYPALSLRSGCMGERIVFRDRGSNRNREGIVVGPGSIELDQARIPTQVGNQ